MRRSLAVIVVFLGSLAGPAVAGDQPAPGATAYPPELAAASPFTPPPCTGIFPDVPCSDQFAPWIEQLYRDRITAGCGGGLYCPGDPVTRAQMAAFLEHLARGSERWPPNIAYVFQVYADNGQPDLVASGQALLNTIAAIPTSGGLMPGIANQYVVRIGPGKYSLQGNALDVPSFVHLEGSGSDATQIFSYHAIHPQPVTTAGPNRISDLLIQMQTPGDNVIAVLAQGSKLVLTDVKVFASAGAQVIGVAASGVEVEIERSDVVAGGSGGQSRAIQLGGTSQRNLTVRDSFLFGTDHAVYCAGSFQVRIIETEVNGAFHESGGGDFLCRDVYSASLVDVSCP